LTTTLSSRQLSGPRAARPAVAAVICWLIALTGIGTIVCGALRGGMVDLDVYRSGAAAILHGTSLYAMRTAIGLQFTYPPVAAILATPLAAVPLYIAMLAWIPLVYGPLAVAVWFGFRPLLVRAGSYSPAVFAAVLGCCSFLLPVRQVMSFGQVDLLLLALCLLDCAVQRPAWPRGMLIGIATAIKLVPGVFIIYLVITGRRKAAAVAAVSFAALSAAAFIVAPRDSAAYWTGAIFDTSRLGGNASAGNQSLRGMILRAFLPHQAPAAIWAVTAVVVAVAGFTAARACWRRGADMAGIAITGLLAAALSPVAWIHHLCWVVVAIGVIGGAGRDWRRVSAAALALGLFLTRLPIWAQAGLMSHELPVLPGRLLEDTFGLAALGLIAVLFKISGPGPDAGGDHGPVHPAQPPPGRARSGLRPAEQAQP
jgi:alpha-1,2-mannosyltransferase